MTGAARYPPDPDPAPGPVTGPAGWIVAAGVSVSLHILAVTGLGLGLLGQPQAPSASGTGLVIKTLPPVTGSAPTLSRPDLARAAARQADSPARDRLTALEEDPSGPAPEAPQARAARLAAGSEARPADIRRASPTMRPTATRPAQVPTMRPMAMRPSQARPAEVPTLQPTAPSSRPDTTQARRVVPVQADPTEAARDSPAPAQAADDLAPRRLAPSEAPERAHTPASTPVRTPVRAERPRAEAPRADSHADSHADSGAETRADPSRATRPARSEPARRVQPEAARRLSPAATTATTRITEAAQATRPTPPPASILAPTRRLATATRPRRGTAPVPQDTRDPASRARRDGPDRRLSDRQAAPAASAEPGIAAALAALQSLAGTPCHTAQPLTRAGAAPAIAIFGTDRARLSEAGRSGGAPDPDRPDPDRPDSDWPDTASRPVTQAQCPALDFIRGAGDDPTKGISLDLWSATAGDRQPLTGVIGHDGPPALHLLLIDTAGQVHDLKSFLSEVPGGSQFSVRVAGAGGATGAGDHHQLLLAIAAPVALALPNGQVSRGQTAPAGPFFEALQEALVREGITPDLALAGFVFE